MNRSTGGLLGDRNRNDMIVIGPAEPGIIEKFMQSGHVSVYLNLWNLK